ncbi:hypothetical protein DSECCO2_326210 [anaerobic digester metagenome]
MNKEQKMRKIDKGFELIYWKLSYRRKFLRTIWLIPFVILAIMATWLVWHSVIITIPIAIVLVLVEMAQAIYTYNMWKRECRGKE